MNDPLGDMLTRIRNAQQRRRPKVSSPASKLRARVLDVLVDEGYIRGYARVDHKNGLSEFEIELKYANGQPAIREINRVSSPDGASTRRCATWPAWPTASASPSCRRPRA